MICNIHIVAYAFVGYVSSICVRYRFAAYVRYKFVIYVRYEFAPAPERIARRQRPPCSCSCGSDDRPLRYPGPGWHIGRVPPRVRSESPVVQPGPAYPECVSPVSPTIRSLQYHGAGGRVLPSTAPASWPYTQALRVPHSVSDAGRIRPTQDLRVLPASQ